MQLYIPLFSCLKILLLLFMPVLTVAADALVVSASTSCDSYDKSLIYQHKLIQGVLPNENENLIQIACLHDYSGVYRIENLTGLTHAEFKSHQITIFTAAHLNGDDFMLTFTHELAHAEQYSKWMKIAQSGNTMSDKLIFIQSMIVPRGMNSPYQTLAKLKKFPEYSKNTKKWLEAYSTVRFCMELNAYRNEYAYAEAQGLEINRLGKHLRPLQQNNEEPLINYLNNTVVKDVYGVAFDLEQLKRGRETCELADEPVSWFSASVEALELL